MPRTRDLARIDYSKLNAKGFDSDSFEMDVLNLSDPNSDLFDNEEYNIQKEIEQLSLSVSKKAAERDHELWELYLQQGAIPKKTCKIRLNKRVYRLSRSQVHRLSMSQVRRR